jgi:hypothetical protein
LHAGAQQIQSHSPNFFERTIRTLCPRVGALYRQFIVQNAAITSDMLAIRYFRRTLL